MSALRWCFTLNNYSAQEEDHIANAHGVAANGIVYIVAGREVGASGTPHLQGFVIFGARKSLIQVKSILGARLHLEVTHSTNERNVTYCKKDGDWFEHGQLVVGQGRRSDWDSYKAWVCELGRVPNDREIAQSFPGLYARYSTACKVIADSALPKPRLVPEGSSLRPWQDDLRSILEQDCDDDRTVCFFVDKEGNKGKSWFCRYMLTEYSERVQVLGVGKIADLAFMVDPEKDIFLFDCARSSTEFLQYQMLEKLKDRYVISTKYASTAKIIRKLPHVCVFMNEDPDMSKLSDDRYSVITLDP